MKSPLRALFYGTTHEHAPSKLEALKRLRDEFEIVAVVDDSARKSPMFRDQSLNVEGFRIVAEKDAFEIADIDVGFVEVTNCDLMEIAGEFAARGIPMHCDKPCGEKMDVYRSVVGMCRAGNIPMQVGYMYRTNPAVRFCWRAVREGWLGEVGFIEADMNHAYNHGNYAEYIGSFKGGILYNLGCHLVDLIEPMVKGEIRRVHTRLRSASCYGPGTRTSGTSLLEFSNAEVLIRAACEMPGGILNRRLRIDGTNGTIDLCPIERFDGERLTLTMTLRHPAGGYAAGRHIIDFGVQVDRYEDQFRELAAIVRGESKFDSAQYDHDLKVHAMTLQMCGVEVG